MDIWLVLSVKGEFMSAWSDHDKAVEHKNSLEQILKYHYPTLDISYHILRYCLDGINEWSREDD